MLARKNSLPNVHHSSCSTGPAKRAGQPQNVLSTSISAIALTLRGWNRFWLTFARETFSLSNRSA